MAAEGRSWLHLRREKEPQLVYAIGRLGVSFISQARRDGNLARDEQGQRDDLKPITDANLQELFADRPFLAQSVVWTVSRTEVPMHAIVPMGAFASDAYEWLTEEWADKNVEFISLPGVVARQGPVRRPGRRRRRPGFAGHGELGHRRLRDSAQGQPEGGDSQPRRAT